MATAKKAPKKKPMSNEHKAALARGREHGRAVKNYLEALSANKPKRGRKRTPDSINKRLHIIAEELDGADPLNTLLLTQEQANLETELGQMEDRFDITDYEAAFVESAAEYGESKGITYNTWRRMGIEPTVLKAAGITR